VQNQDVSAQVHDVATLVRTWITRPVLSAIRGCCCCCCCCCRDHGGFGFGLEVLVAAGKVGSYGDSGSSSRMVVRAVVVIVGRRRRQGRRRRGSKVGQKHLVVGENVDGHGKIGLVLDAKGKDDALGRVTMVRGTDGGALASSLLLLDKKKVLRLWGGGGDDGRGSGGGGGGGGMLGGAMIVVSGLVGGLPCFPCSGFSLCHRGGGGGREVVGSSRKS